MTLVIGNLVREVAKATRLHKDEARVVVERILDEVIRALQSGERVEIRGLGSFRSRKVMGRKGRDMKRGQTLALPPLIRMSFRPGKGLNHRVLREPEAEVSGQYLMFGPSNPISKG
jgi:integration host factor subunit beta